MTENPTTGGPAFPAPAQPLTDLRMEDVTSGMSLRDWFAGQAIGSACAHAFANIAQARNMGLLPEEWAAKIALRVADELLATRSSSKEA